MVSNFQFNPLLETDTGDWKPTENPNTVLGGTARTSTGYCLFDITSQGCKRRYQCTEVSAIFGTAGMRQNASNSKTTKNTTEITDFTGASECVRMRQSASECVKVILVVRQNASNPVVAKPKI